MSGLIAIVGRPNVGKSALFNRIVGRRIAIVHDQPGVTRDRISAEGDWNGRPFSLVDTGGIGLLRGEKASDVITAAALQQVDMALEAADVILFVVNVQEGIVPLDVEVAKKLRITRKPVLVVVNKSDNHAATNQAGEFDELGFNRLFPVSAIHGGGITTLMEAALEYLPKPDAAAVPNPAADAEAGAEPDGAEEKDSKGRPKRRPERPRGPVRLAVVGRPNVGKSSIINAVTGSERVIVSPIPGTTRDAVDVPFEVDTEGVREQYVLVDTAGVRKSRRIDDTVEFFSVNRTKEAIARSDIAILVIDAENGITEQDKKIADTIVEERRSCIVVVNKWDLVAADVRKAREEEVVARQAKTRDRDDRQKRMTTLSEFGQWVQKRLFFLDYAPVIFTSAKDGFQLDRLLEAVRYVSAQLRQKVPTAILNRTLNDAIERRQPVSDMGHRLKFYYATQVQQAPPTFLLFVNRDELFGATYLKYLQGELRAAFGYEGCPIILAPKPRPKTIDPVRKYKKHPFADKGAAASAPVGGRANRSGGPRPVGPRPAGAGPRREGPPRRPGEKPAVRSGSRAGSRPDSRPGSRPDSAKDPRGRSTTRPGRRPAPAAGRGRPGKGKGSRGGPGGGRRR
jgi:GTPase